MDRFQREELLHEAIINLANNDPRKRQLGTLVLGKLIQQAVEDQNIGHEIHDLLHPAFEETKTGLISFERFKSQVEYYIAHPEAGGAVVISYDLIDFKKLNDQKGHEVGDMFIAESGKALSHLTRNRQDKRKPDFTTNLQDPDRQIYPSRIGGDEFATLLTNVENANEINLNRLCLTKIHDFLRYKGLRHLIEKYRVEEFGIRAGATVLDKNLSYSQNMSLAHPKNLDEENKNLRAKAWLVKQVEKYIIVDG